ncbi:AEC family transporter [Bacillus massiliglaciei]|uniref:AEC family transporter n=1 Tax=Bacillus massiliglaciei TaxID=1816693 RepID=UPI000DA63B9C|nr:AEC family transporter [Bacillus massiliglaciei]
MDYFVLISTILRLAVLLGIGMWLTRKVSVTKDVRGFLIFLLINLALPAIILNGFFQIEITDELMKQMIFVFLFSISFNAAGLLLAWGVSRGIGLGALKARETAFLSAFGNTGLIGIPLCASIFGAKGAVLAAVFDAGMSLTLWTLGVLFIQGSKEISAKNMKAMISAPNAAVFIGLIVTVFKLDMVFFVKDVTASVSAIASPLAMFYIGMLTMTIIKEKRKVPAKLIMMPLSLKLIAFPILGILVISAMNLPADMGQLMMIEMAMPTVTSASVIFGLYQADEDYGVMQTLVTNLAVLVTVPVIVLLGGLLL